MKRGYPAGVLKRLHEVELDILLAIDKVCEDNGLTYFLDSGTALGAVRHGGFIPWDDDVDIGLPLDDYRRFLKIAPDALPRGFSVHTALNTEGLASLWVKVFADGTRFIDNDMMEAGCNQGIFVDVFPYCSLPKDESEVKSLVRQATKLQRMSYLHFIEHPKVPRTTPFRPLVQLGCVVTHFFTARFTSIDKIAHDFDDILSVPGDGRRWYDPCYGSFVFDNDDLFPMARLDFEGHSLPVPANCDAYLKVLYGDYNQLPSEEDRYTHTPIILDFGESVNVMEDMEE